jgi:transposase-like protein
MGQTLHLVPEFKDERTAYHYLEQLRWPEGCRCPYCGSDQVDTSAKGPALTRAGKPRDPPPWRCRGCHTTFSVLSGTPLARSRIGASTWITLVRLLCSAEYAVSGSSLKAALPLSDTSISAALRRVRRVFQAFPLKEVVRPVLIRGQEVLLPPDPEVCLRVLLAAALPPPDRATWPADLEGKVAVAGREPDRFSWVFDLLAALPFGRTNESDSGWRWSEQQRAFFLSAFAEALDASMCLVEDGAMEQVLWIRGLVVRAQVQEGERHDLVVWRPVEGGERLLLCTSREFHRAVAIGEDPPCQDVSRWQVQDLILQCASCQQALGYPPAQCSDCQQFLCEDCWREERQDEEWYMYVKCPGCAQARQGPAS